MIKLLDIINELNINNPHIKWNDLFEFDKDNLNIIKDPNTHLKNLKTICLSDSNRYSFLNSIYKKGFYNIIYTDNLDFININYYNSLIILKTIFSTFIKITNK